MFGRKKIKKKQRAEQERIRQTERKREMENDIRLHEKELAENMNLRLICSMGIENTLWVDSVTVTELLFPDQSKNKKKRKKGFLCRLHNSFQAYRWTI